MHPNTCLQSSGATHREPLERYLRIASLFILFLESSATSSLEVSLASVLDFLAIARASHSQDLEVHRISAESPIKALRWFVRQAQWDCLSNALNSPVIRAYSRRGTAQDRREALPIPWALITGWEERVCDPTAPLTTKAVLGAALLATHASLRFGDLQRVEFSSLSLSTSALHGICFATKTTTHGQPFAVTLAGITGRNLSSCWTLHWLAALQSLVTPHLQQEEAPDFLWLSTALDAQALDELAPASYCTALLCLRYVATLPWRVAGSGLLPGEARQLTLHSMKSTLLAAAAQLRLAKEIRLAQGHHRDSARLYSRNDTFDSLDAQHRLATAMSTGWRPNRSVARGGQAPIPEPPFSLPPGEPLSCIAPQDILSGPWNYFVSRHEALHAASQATAPTQLDASAPVSRHQLSHSTEDPIEQFSMPSPDIIDDYSDEEAAMVEQAAQLNRSSSASSVSESSVSSQDVPIVEGESTAPLFACLGPWGCWHSLLPPDESGIVHTACGLALGTASFTSNAPPHPLCRRRACVIQRAHRYAKKVARFSCVTASAAIIFMPALRSDRGVPRLARSVRTVAQPALATAHPQPFLLKLSALTVQVKHGHSHTSVQRCIGRTFRFARQHAGSARPLPRTGKHRHRIGARFCLRI